MKLHLFYPENDLALASGKAGYTPPPKVMDLRRAGAVLPLWYGDPGDKVCTTGVSAAWFDSMAERFDLRTDVFDHTYHSTMGMVGGFGLIAPAAGSTCPSFAGFGASGTDTQPVAPPYCGGSTRACGGSVALCNRSGGSGMYGCGGPACVAGVGPRLYGQTAVVEQRTRTA